MVASDTSILLKQAIKLDFTGSLAGFRHFKSFADDVVALIRSSKGTGALLVVDYGFAFSKPEPHVVCDHLNLTGCNPLVGANDPLGERFPSVNDIYVTDLLPQLPRGIAAGVKPYMVLSDAELKLIKKLGADFYCYNLVPAMIVAAHARMRVLGIVVPPGAGLDALQLLSMEGGN